MWILGCHGLRVYNALMFFQYIYFAVRVAIIPALVAVFFVFVLLVDFRVFFYALVFVSH